MCPEGEGNLRRVAERARKSGRLKVQEAPWRYAQVEKRRKSPALGEGTVGQHKDGQAVREQARQDRVLPAEQKGEQEDTEASWRAESSCKLSSESSRTASAACVVPLAAREPEVGSLGTDEERLCRMFTVAPINQWLKKRASVSGSKLLGSQAQRGPSSSARAASAKCEPTVGCECSSCISTSARTKRSCGGTL